MYKSLSFPAEKEQVLAKLFEANEFFEFNLRQANYLKKNNEIQEYMVILNNFLEVLDFLENDQRKSGASVDKRPIFANKHR